MSVEDYYEIFEPRFGRLINGNAHVERLFTGCRWAEGPAWFGGGRYLIWSDIPNDRMLRYDETDGHVNVFRSPAGNSNGNAVDIQGRLVSCEHGNRRVSRTEHDGTVVTLADRWNGKRLNSPNDLAIRSDGSVWFTDPSYGIETDYEGNKATPEIEGCHVYRIDPATGQVEAMITDMVRPNGLAFSPDESKLFVSDSGRTHGVQFPAHIRSFDVGSDGHAVSGGKVFAESPSGLFDGFRLDADGRVWTSAADGIRCYDTDGTPLGRIKVPEVVANCTFGGRKKNVLFICGTTSLYSVRLMVNGAV